MSRKLLIGLVVGLLALGAFFTVAKAGTSTTDGINVDYKAELLAAADDLLDAVHDLLVDLTFLDDNGVIDEDDGIFPQLVLFKDCKVGYLAALESALKFGDDENDLIPVATTIIEDGWGDKCEPLQTMMENELALVNTTLNNLHGSLADVEAAVQGLISNIETAILEGLIGQETAESLIKKTIIDEETGLEHPYAPLLVIMVFLSDKNIYLVEIDKLFEQAIEYESEALAWLSQVISTCTLMTDPLDCMTKAFKEAIKALKNSIKKVREAEKYLWLIKDNIKDIKAWLCGFKQLVIRAPLLVPEEVPAPPICPWCLPPLAAAATELRTYSEPGTIRFAAFGGAVQGMRVQVFSLSGKTVFDSGLVAGNMLAWRTYDVANGVYLYVVEVKTPAGLTRSEVRKLAVVK